MLYCGATNGREIQCDSNFLRACLNMNQVAAFMRGVAVEGESGRVGSTLLRSTLYACSHQRGGGDASTNPTYAPPPIVLGHFEPRDIVGALYCFNLQFGMMALDPLSKVFAGVSPVDPDHPQAYEPPRESLQDFLSTVSLRATGRRDNNTQQKPEYVHEDMTPAALDIVQGTIAILAAAPVRLDAMAVEACRTGFGVAALLLPEADSEGVVESSPGMIEGPLAEDIKTRSAMAEG